MTITTEPTVLTTSGLIGALAVNVKVIGMQTAGLTHADTLLQPAPRGNCLNWVLGHVLVFRSYMLNAIGTLPEFDLPDPARYGYGSQPITEDGNDIVSLPDLLATLIASQEQIAREFSVVRTDALAAPSQRSNDRTLAADIEHLMWHETYHVGQTELLRQLAGTNDTVV